MIDFQGVMAPGLNGLEFEYWRHLFEWRGALVCEGGDPVGHEQDSLEPKDITDWSRTQFKEHSDAPMKVDRASATHLPNQSLDELRRQYLPKTGDRRRSALDEKQAHPTRPNSATLFDAMQHEAIALGIPNKALLDMELNLGENQEPTLDDATYYAGAEWALQIFTVDALGFKLIQLPMLQALKIEGACQVAIAHGVSRHSKEKLGDILHDLDRKHYRHLQREVREKLELCKAEIGRWTSAATVPVLTTAGEECRVLTLINIASAWTGIRGIRGLANNLFSFSAGVSAVRRNLEIDLPLGTIQV